MILSLNPLVAVADDFITPDECREFITWSLSEMEEALVCGPDGTRIPDPNRTGEVGYLEHNTSPVIQDVCNRISGTVNIHPKFAEAFQIVHYGLTQRYDPHYDGWEDKEYPFYKDYGQRTLTALLYLNTPAQGGETVFPKLNVKVPAKRGRLVVFQNVILGTDTIHPQSLHGGAPVEKGEKWVANLWYRVQKVR